MVNLVSLVLDVLILSLMRSKLRKQRKDKELMIQSLIKMKVKEVNILQSLNPIIKETIQTHLEVKLLEGECLFGETLET